MIIIGQQRRRFALLWIRLRRWKFSWNECNESCWNVVVRQFAGSVCFVTIKFHHNDIIVATTVSRIVNDRSTVERCSHGVHGVHSRALAAATAPICGFPKGARERQNVRSGDRIGVAALLVFHIFDDYLLVAKKCVAAFLLLSYSAATIVAFRYRTTTE